MAPALLALPSVLVNTRSSGLAGKQAMAAVRHPSAPALLRNSDLDGEAVRNARVDLAACFRMAARLGLHEGICNHFSFVVPGRDDLFLVNPYGWAFSEITASRLLICDFEGNVVAGEGVPEATAFYIHARIHLRKPRARAAFHTHMPNATALAMLEGPPLRLGGPDARSNSTAAPWSTRTTTAWRWTTRRATASPRASATARRSSFLKNHGVLIVGGSIAAAWDDLYYLERACEAQRLAMATGRALKAVPEPVAARTAAQMREGDGESARLHLESIKRILARSEPDFAD